MTLTRRNPRWLLAGLAALAVLFLALAGYQLWQSRADRARTVVFEPLRPGQAARALRLTIYDDGLMAVSMRQVAEANLPVDDLSTASLSLTRDGRPVPSHVEGAGRDAILYFYATAVTNTLEAPAVYWLSPGAGLPMARRPAPPQGAAVSTGRLERRWEENVTFQAQAGGDDVWLGKLLFAPNSLDIPLIGVRPNSSPAGLTVRIWSNNQSSVNPDHHVEVLLNGRLLGDHYWDGIRQETIVLPVPAAMLQAEDNRLTIHAPGDTGAAGEALYIDWVNLAYQGNLDAFAGPLRFQSDAGALQITGVSAQALALDVTDPDSPVLLTQTEFGQRTLRFQAGGPGGEYLVLARPDQALQPTMTIAPAWPTPLTAASRGADYIAIVADAPGFDVALQPLLRHRESQGLRVAAVPLDQLFDEFGHGRRTPEAIRDFLSYAVANWQPPAPRFVLLVGDASYDLHNFTGGKNANLLPTHLIFTEYAGYVASDTWFTILEPSGAPQAAGEPLLALGRLPAQTASQLTTMVNKTISYESAAGDDWLRRALLVADDELSFNTASDGLAAELEPTGFETLKLYMTENENTQEVHDALIGALNQGVGILNYVGHGSIEVWGDEKVFQNDDASLLINGRRLPIFTTFTCLNGYFNHPQVDALAETLLWTADGGVVAAIAPSGRSLTMQQLPLADSFYQALLSGRATTLGEALLQAKQPAAADAFLKDVVHTFNLLGDPALRFNLPPPPAATSHVRTSP